MRQLLIPQINLLLDDLLHLLFQMIDLPFVTFNVFLAGGLHVVVLVFQVLKPLLQLINILGLAIQALMLLLYLLLQRDILGGHLAQTSYQLVYLDVFLLELLLKDFQLVDALVQVVDNIILFFKGLFLFIEHQIQLVFFVLLLLNNIVFLLDSILQFFNLYIELALPRDLNLHLSIRPEGLFLLLNMLLFSLFYNFFAPFELVAVTKDVPGAWVLFHESFFVFFFVLVLEGQFVICNRSICGCQINLETVLLSPI